jgi:hypothetical protein
MAHPQRARGDQRREFLLEASLILDRYQLAPGVDADVVERHQREGHQSVAMHRGQEEAVLVGSQTEIDLVGPRAEHPLAQRRDLRLRAEEELLLARAAAKEPAAHARGLDPIQTLRQVGHGGLIHLMTWTLVIVMSRTYCGPDATVTASPAEPCRTILVRIESDNEPPIRIVRLDLLMTLLTTIRQVSPSGATPPP